LETESQLLKLIETARTYNFSSDQIIIVSCVDNNKTRKIISKALESYRSAIWVDVGNELVGGQAFLQYNSVTGIKTRLLDVFKEINTPTDKLPTEMSCADRVASGEQSLIVNSLAAMMAFTMITSLIEQRKMYYYQIDFAINGTIGKKYIDDYLKNLEDMKKASLLKEKIEKESEEAKKAKIIAQAQPIESRAASMPATSASSDAF